MDFLDFAFAAVVVLLLLSICLLMFSVYLHLKFHRKHRKYLKSHKSPEQNWRHYTVKTTVRSPFSSSENSEEAFERVRKALEAVDAEALEFGSLNNKGPQTWTHRKTEDSAQTKPKLKPNKLWVCTRCGAERSTYVRSFCRKNKGLYCTPAKKD